MATKRSPPECPICKRDAHRTKDGWVDAPWRWVCIAGSCHYVGDVRHNAGVQADSRGLMREVAPGTEG